MNSDQHEVPCPLVSVCGSWDRLPRRSPRDTSDRVPPLMASLSRSLLCFRDIRKWNGLRDATVRILIGG
jgi:hypothetical protein